MPTGRHQLCGSCQQNPSLYEHSLEGCFASMPGRGETKLLALGPAAHPYVCQGASIGDFGLRLWGRGTGTWHMLMALSWLALGSVWSCEGPTSKDGVTGRAARRRKGWSSVLAPQSLARHAAHPRPHPTPLALKSSHAKVTARAGKDA